MAQVERDIMIEDLMSKVENLEFSNRILDEKLDKALEDRIVLRNENYKLKERLRTQTTHTTTEEEECLACSAQYNMVAKVSKITERARVKGKLLKPKAQVNPYAKALPKKEANRKFKQRPMRKTASGQQPLGKTERLNKPLRTARSRYGGK